MSMRLAAIVADTTIKPKTRAKLLALVLSPVYDDGRTKQSFKDETDIQKIMVRADKAGTISHLEKFEGVYGDYSDLDFHELTTQLAKGREIFAELPAEIRQEFGQDPDKFFAYVNDEAHKDQLRKDLPALAEPGRQNISITPPTADEEAAAKAADPLSADPAEPAA